MRRQCPLQVCRDRRECATRGSREAVAACKNRRVMTKSFEARANSNRSNTMANAAQVTPGLTTFSITRLTSNANTIRAQAQAAGTAPAPVFVNRPNVTAASVNGMPSYTLGRANHDDWTTRQVCLVESRELSCATWQTATGADAVLCRRYVSTGFPPLLLPPLPYCASFFLVVVTSRCPTTSRLWPRASSIISKAYPTSPITMIRVKQFVIPYPSMVNSTKAGYFHRMSVSRDGSVPTCSAHWVVVRVTLLDPMATQKWSLFVGKTSRCD